LSLSGPSYRIGSVTSVKNSSICIPSLSGP
jgi:hypothetical protein